MIKILVLEDYFRNKPKTTTVPSDVNNIYLSNSVHVSQYE